MKKSVKRQFKLTMALLTGLSVLSLPLHASAAGTYAKDKTQEEQRAWFQQNAHEITSMDSEDYRDLEFLKPLLKDKTVVSLGENFHVVAEYSSLKTRIIKYLHEELDFDVIAFESGVGDAAAVYEQRDSLTAEQMMGASIFPVWHSQETLGLFDYIKEQGEGTDPLYLAGYDMQFNSYYLTYFIGEAIAKLDLPLGKKFVQTDMQAMNDLYAVINKYGLFDTENEEFTKEITEVIERYTPQYEEVIRFVDLNKAQIAAGYPDSPYLADIILKTLQNRIAFMEMALYDTKGGYEFRDRMMAENVEWLMKTVYPGKKVILWAHNDHLSKNTSSIRVKEKGEWMYSFASMGEQLHQALKDDMYVIGFYMNRGEAAAISTREPFTIEPMPEGSLENLFITNGYPNTFVDLSQHKIRNRQNAWMFQRIYAAEDGMTEEVIRPNVMRFVPKAQYDGIIVIDKVKAPTPLEVGEE
jgi:erythromycin esterase